MKISFNQEVLDLLMPDARDSNTPPHVLARKIILDYYRIHSMKETQEHEQKGTFK